MNGSVCGKNACCTGLRSPFCANKIVDPELHILIVHDIEVDQTTWVFRVGILR